MSDRRSNGGPRAGSRRRPLVATDRYDARGRPTSVRLPRGAVSFTAYATCDALGRVTATAERPASRSWATTYRNEGRDGGASGPGEVE
jgi:YD repeat-containing protein